MDEVEYVVAGTVAVIVLVTLVSGPLVGAVDFTDEPDETTFAPGSGEIDATVLSVPERALLEQGSYGSGAYYLRVPAATVDAERITGQPMLVYKIRIPELGYTRGTTHFLNSSNAGELTVTLSEGTIAPEQVDREQYDGELLLLTRSDAGERTLSRTNVTVEVRE